MPPKAQDGSGPIADLNLSVQDQKLLLASFKCNKNGIPQVRSLPLFDTEAKHHPTSSLRLHFSCILFRPFPYLHRLAPYLALNVIVVHKLTKF